ncbi:hypothetical protein GCM10010909_23850 [Acidocella aquatica]|uniref:Uncharacterized protein n=1 Tax=Acidocella aquatica TaxID=1922313 RepID=A0ABQ6A5H3_9PROT|nr:hypothetical protein [Acidocella aquatica]GLR67704.1 hypothetical protein GCM10010909_23850 [Acidocella aquatica]
MELENQGDHIALLALMISGVLIHRLDQIGQLDETTALHLHKLVAGVRIHAKSRGLTDLNTLFDNLDRTLAHKLPKA